jgi:hypothetical protein
MVTIACLLLAAAAQTPVVDVVAPVDPAITVTLTPRDGPYTALLTNNTDRPIFGVAVIWQLEGGHKYTVQSDSYGSTTKTPVVSPRGQIILTPDGFYPVGTSSNPTVGVRPASSHRELDEAYHVTINVDAVIFDDGLILGPDSSRLEASIQGRAEAIERIFETVQKARAEGHDITAALRSMMPPPGTNLALQPLDRVTNWIIVYAGELSRFPARRDYRLSELGQLPKPPTFFRK